MKGDFTAADTLLRQALATNQTLLTEPHSRLASVAAVERLPR